MESIDGNETWLRMIQLARESDPDEDSTHADRVGVISELLYRGWATQNPDSKNHDSTTADVLRVSAMLHDVGKQFVPTEILRKAESLTEDEFAQIRVHTVAGSDMFASPTTAVESMAAIICLRHHERWDGGGYPGSDWLLKDGRLTVSSGLKGEDIPLVARVVAIADVYDALCSERVYKPAWLEADVLAYLRQGAGTHFDPVLVAVFFDIYSEIRAARLRLSDV